MLYEQPDLYSEIYDGFAEDIPFYRDLALSTDGPVCELACGSGRVTIPLARAGVPITGIDLSSEMIAAGRAAAQAITQTAARGAAGTAAGGDTPPPHPVFLVGDMRDPPLTDPAGGYGLFLIPLHSLSHLEETDDVLRCLRSVRRALIPRGRLGLAVHNPDPATLARDPEALFPVTIPGDGKPRTAISILESTRYDRTRQLLYVRWWVEKRMAGRADNVSPSHEARPDRDPVPIDFTLRMFFPCELELLLRQAGFVLEERYGWYDRSPFTDGSGTQLIIARATGTQESIEKPVGFRRGVP